MMQTKRLNDVGFQNRKSIRYWCTGSWWLLALAVFALSFSACQSGELRSRRALHDFVREQLDSAFHIPGCAARASLSPYLLVAFLQSDAHIYDAALLSKIPPQPSIETTLNDALLLGFLSVDLSYAAYYGHRATAEKYLVSLSETAERLGLSSVIRIKELDSIRSEWDAWGSVLRDLPLRLKKMLALLQEQEREAHFILVEVGAWVEMSRILTYLALTTEHPELRLWVAEQRYPLSSLTECLAEYVYKAPLMTELFTQLTELEEIYSAVHVAYTYETPYVDTAEHLIQINNTMLVSMSSHQLQALHHAFESIKNCYSYAPE